VETPISKDISSDRPRFRLSAWFWKPWYAKLWWFCAVAFWLIAEFAPRETNPFNSTTGSLVMLAFHPFALLWYGFFRALWRWRARLAVSWEPNGDADADLNDEGDGLYGVDGIGFHRPVPMSYLSDPTDIRSPMNPLNPAYIGRHRH